MNRNLNEHQFANQVWYHGGSKPEGDRLIHLGTHAAASERINPASWDPPEEFPEIGQAKMWEVRLSPDTRFHPDIAKDDDGAGSLYFKGPRGYDGQAYVNQYEDRGSHSIVVHGSKIAFVREVTDPHASARESYRRSVL